MAPHYEYLESDFNEICECHGSNVGDVFSRYQGENIIDARSLSFVKNAKLLMQLDEWCNYIFPGIAVRVEKTGSQMYKLKIRNDVAPNVGFGITYALPILVSGLTVPNDGILIVENPEAHLHAKAQSNMGYFLARMAAAGVRVIIETHSEHIVNGIRRMIVEGKSEMSHEDMTIYFFQNKDGEKDIKEITMDDIGNLSEFPVDFFDQVRQDMLELMKLERKRKGMKDGEW
jgi:predicted ATPase